MRLGLIADIHANREGFEAALTALARAGIDQLALLGDIVGHVHKAHLWRLVPQGMATGHVPHANVEIPLAQSQCWLGVIGEKLHQGGMAEIHAVSKAGIDLPLAMKVPLILKGDDPTMIVGARGSGGVRRHLGSVSTAIVAEAPCTVTVARLPATEQANEAA